MTQESVSSQVQPAAISDSGELLAFVSVIPVDLGGEKYLLLNGKSGAQMVVARRVASKLPLCNVFRTLAAHARHLCEMSTDLRNPADVLRVLEMVRDAGLFTSAESVCDRLQGATAEEAAPLAPTRVFVLTCDRPESLARLLESMLAASLAQHEELFLIDDSRSEENAARNRDAVEQFNRTSDKAMRYLGRTQQQAFMAALVRALPERENGIRFLIDSARWVGHKTYGLARTLCLLHSVGRRAIVVDDDTLCEAVKSPLSKPGLAFKDSSREVCFYSSEEDIAAKTQAADFDPLAGHARCLGMTLGSAISELSESGLGPQDLYEQNGVFLSPFTSQSPVILTQCGYLGDPGTQDSRWLYLLDGGNAQRLLGFSEGWEKAHTLRHNWVGQPRPTFTKTAHMSGMTGVDNSRLLPPYFPILRGEDQLFGAMVEHLHPDAIVLDYDWCIPHIPQEDRADRVEAAIPDSRGKFSRESLITRRTLYEAGPDAGLRLRRFVLMLRELQQSSDRELTTLYRQQVAELQGIQETMLLRLLADDIWRPTEWEQYLTQTRAGIAEAQREVARLQDIEGVPANADDGEILAQFRELIGGFADSLDGWPEVRAAAREISDAMLAAGELAP